MTTADKKRNTATLKRNKPGRPEGQTNLRDKILDVGEIHFAELGYSGASLRQVAEDAGVNSAMISYYFSSKENLFREVFLRKGSLVANERMEELERLRERGELTTQNVVRAFLAPSMRLRQSQQGRAFLRLHSRLHMEPESISYELRSTVYDESTRAYAKAFREILPGKDERQVYFHMSLMIGSYLYAFSDTNRLDELLPSGAADDHVDDLETTVRFIAAGMES